MPCQRVPIDVAQIVTGHVLAMLDELEAAVLRCVRDGVLAGVVCRPAADIDPQVIELAQGRRIPRLAPGVALSGGVAERH